jgi:pimeloyl-ACP methyl ester carboxylesterase
VTKPEGGLVRPGEIASPGVATDGRAGHDRGVPDRAQHRSAGEDALFAAELAAEYAAAVFEPAPERDEWSPVEWAKGAVDQDGNTVVYTDLGPSDGPVVLLVHGMISDSTTWTRAAQGLAAAGFRVIAPDLLGHGESSKPADAGYLLPDFANSLQRLLIELGTGPATVVGHSLGGAIVMQLAKDHPELVRRLVLVSAGGLGRRIHPVFRMVTLPGAHPLFRLTLNRRTSALLRRPRLHRSLRLSEDVLANLERAGRGLITPSGRAAFFRTLRGVITAAGQRGSLIEHGYLPRSLPTLIVWSIDDPIVPVEHAYSVHRHLPASRLELFEGTTHQPHHVHADRFVTALAAFVRET